MFISTLCYIVNGLLSESLFLVFSQNVLGKSIHAYVNIMIKTYKEGWLINTSGCFCNTLTQIDFDV